MSASDGTVLVNLGAVRAPSTSVACEIASAVLHTILFERLMAPCTPLVEQLLIGTKEMSYAMLDSESVRARVSECVARLTDTLNSAVIGVAQVEVALGTLNSQVRRERKRLAQQASSSAGGAPEKMLGKVSRWASWLTDALAQKEQSSFAASQQSAVASSSGASRCEWSDKKVIDSGDSVVWERWRITIYIVQSLGANECAEHAEMLLDTLQQLLDARRNYVPSPCSSGQQTFPFRVAVRDSTRIHEQNDKKIANQIESKELSRSVQTAARHTSSTHTRLPQKKSAARPIRSRNASLASQNAAPSASDQKRDETDPWWKTLRLSPGSGRWEESLDLLRDVVGSAPTLSSSPPF